MEKECIKCKQKNKLIGKLLAYVVDDCCDIYERLKEDYGPNHPETQKISRLLTELVLILEGKNK